MNSNLSNSAYKSLIDFTLELYKLEDIRDVLPLIVETTADLLNADRCTIYFF